jgi:hypothetical protein
VLSERDSDMRQILSCINKLYNKFYSLIQLELENLRILFLSANFKNSIFALADVPASKLYVGCMKRIKLIELGF